MRNRNEKNLETLTNVNGIELKFLLRLAPIPYYVCFNKTKLLRTVVKFEDSRINVRKRN